MIGVAAKTAENEVVREFFQLFKSPWQFVQSGRKYDVILSTLDDVPESEADVYLIFNSKQLECDPGGVRECLPKAPIAIRPIGAELPIYGSLSIFDRRRKPVLMLTDNSRIAGIELFDQHRQIYRIGYDLFFEVFHLLSEGQSAENAIIPALDIHIYLLKDLILKSGFPVVEIPPMPFGHDFICCLTHDVDFAGIRHYKFDPTLLGFIYRAVIGTVIDAARKKTRRHKLRENLLAVLSLPLVYLGLRTDFWLQFTKYLEIENEIRSTFFLIPFKNRPGEKIISPDQKLRASKYDLDEIASEITRLLQKGCEIGVHGIDAWHSHASAVKEGERIFSATGKSRVGIRMHWLYFDKASFEILDQSGFDYDSTVGFNETVGYKAGTTQVYKPFSSKYLLELPLHIQDVSMFFNAFMDLSEEAAWELCLHVFDDAERFGGAVTVLWHMRSLAPERLWDQFYIDMIKYLKNRRVWFGTAGEIVDWFRQRRRVEFVESRARDGKIYLKLKTNGQVHEPGFMLRVHFPQKEEYGGPRISECLWKGQPEMTFESA